MIEPEENRVRSVENGVIQRLSVSAIERYDPKQFGGCNRRWWFTSVARQKEPERRATILGGDIHDQLEAYSKTGEDNLSPIARAGKHFVPTLKQFGSGIILFEYKFNDAQICGVPFEGKIDQLNLTGYTLNNEGEIQIESDGTLEICDWKTSSDIDAYAKSATALIDTVQMPGYGAVAVAKAQSELDFKAKHVRLSHGYFQTRGKKYAEKRSILIPVERIASRWKEIEQTVEEMKGVARISSAEQVSPNLEACSAWGGCPHSAYCPLSGAQVFSAISFPDHKEAGENDMSLRDAATQAGLLPPGAQTQQAQSPQHVYQPGQPQPPQHFQQPYQPSQQSPPQGYGQPPGQNMPQYAPGPNPEDVARARAQLEAEDAANRTNYGPCNACGQPLSGLNTSVLQDRTIMHIGCPARPPQITPPDQPPIQPHQAAAPIPPEQMGQIPANVQPYAQAHAAQTQAYQQAQNPMQVYAQTAPPSGNGSSLMQSPPQQPTQAAAEPATRRGRPKGSKKAASAKPSESWTIYVDCRPDGATEADDIMEYVDDVVRSLMTYHKAADLRLAPDNKALAYGAWKGAVAASLRALIDTAPNTNPDRISPGAYLVTTKGDFGSLAAEIMCETARTFGGTVVTVRG